MHQQQQQPGSLVVARHDRHVLIRHRDEKGFEHALTGVSSLGERQLLVMATPGAHRVPSLVTDLPGLVGEFATGMDALWLGISSLATDTEAAQRLATELDIEIVVPDGGVAAMPGAALYAGHGAGGLGWHRFRPDRLVEFHGARFPLPDWESWLPSVPVEAGDSVAVPMPCGLFVRGREDDVDEVVFEIPVNQRFPKIVVAVPSAADVAALLGGFPPHPVMVVPARPEVAAHAWQAELALRLSRDVVFSAGPQLGASTVVPGRGFRPFPLVLSQPANAGDQQVLAIAPAPPGWVRAGERSYRLEEGDDDVVAEVVPSGLVLRATGGDADPGAGAAPFDPERWTLTLGVRGQALGLPVLVAAENLLAALDGEQREAVVVRMAGVPDEAAEHALDHRAGAVRVPAPAPVPQPEPLVSRPPIMTTSAAPVSTVSGPVAPVARRPEPVAEPVREEPPVREPPTPEPVEPPPQPAAVPVRASSAAEQTRFTAAAGEAFGEALATVNAALATWPSMRVDDSPGSKADYVAVCLYLSRGEGGAGAVNGVLRTGQPGALDGQVPCLVSGLRRLPTHRRAVLRQGRVAESLEHRSTPGTVLTEPGFLAASMDLDVTVPGADLDVLIWPASARRTSELMLSRPIGEAVFAAGARFKALAVRLTPDEDQDEAEAEEDTLTAPKVAVLFRELAPGEAPDTTDLDERDLAVLAKLDTVLARRQKGALRAVEDPETIARLTTSMVRWQSAGRTAVAS